MCRTCTGLCVYSVVSDCDPMDCSPPGSSVHGIFQVRILEWVAISCSRGSSQPRGQTHVSYMGRLILYYCFTWEVQNLIIYYKMNILVTKTQVKKQNVASLLQVLSKCTNSIKSSAFLTFMLLLLLSRCSCVRLCATPQTAAHQAPPSLGFSRQEHWSGLPFPSLMHESEK